MSKLITDFFKKNDEDTQDKPTKVKKSVLASSPKKLMLKPKKKVIRKETLEEKEEKLIDEVALVNDSNTNTNDDETEPEINNDDETEPETNDNETDGTTTTSTSKYDDIENYLTDSGWRECLSKEFQAPYFKSLVKKLNDRYGKEPIYPPKEEIFSALNYTHFDNVKVVIVGQDPYHGPGQAHGLSFSVKMGVPPPPSLKNMYKELKSDIDGFTIPTHGFLEKWANQGVFLLNAALTVEQGNPNSHKDFGWYTFTDAILKKLNESDRPIVFLLWGGFAQKKGAKLDGKKHLILKSGHPSPLSIKHFEGCKHFSKANEFLVSKGIDPIDWNL